MKIIVPKPIRVLDTVRIAKLKVFMIGRTDTDFELIRVSLTEFAALADGEIHQIAVDAGFTVKA